MLIFSIHYVFWLIFQTSEHEEKEFVFLECLNRCDHSDTHRKFSLNTVKIYWQDTSWHFKFSFSIRLVTYIKADLLPILLQSLLDFCKFHGLTGVYHRNKILLNSRWLFFVVILNKCFYIKQVCHLVTLYY